MGVAKKTRKFGQVKRVLGLRDARLKENKAKAEILQKEKAAKKTINGELVREAPQMPSHMFFEHNTALAPPYNILVDTNFLSHTVQRKLSLLESMMDCLYAKCNIIITSCVMAELEKLGPKYRLALRVARDERWQRLQCDHKGTYADDCLVDKVTKNRIYIVGTNDKALKQRLRKVAGVPLCVRRGLVESCNYVPRPERKRPSKGMSARLKRLEGMVRQMMDVEGKPVGPKEIQKTDEVPELKGQVVQGERATTYVGATHIMAMLEDIEDLKGYLEDEADEEEEGLGPTAHLQGTDVLLHAKNTPRNRNDLLARLPERSVADRLIMRYFTCMSPSQHIIHRPAFTRARPHEASLHWIAQLFLMLALGVHFNQYSAPHELVLESSLSPKERVKEYKTCAGWALVWGKYTQPTIETLPAFLLYVESDFMFSRAAQMTCYTLSAVCIRLMLKMGLHRDPDKLAGIPPFEAEMRRRMWNMAVQVELIVAFHMGLPSLITGIETDTGVPRNLWDEDYDEDSKELPPERPPTDYTAMTYPIHKTLILRAFGQIARQAHALNPPTYEEVMTLDNLVEITWQKVPTFLKVRPLDECGGEPSALLVQRFGLGALYYKSRCVLHRRYLADPVPKPEHDYSRNNCLEAAMTLLDYQHVIWQACKPGHIMSDKGWYVSSLAVHDYLLAAMVVYLVIRNEKNWDSGDAPTWARQQPATPTKDKLKDLLIRSHRIWCDVAVNSFELRKTADALATMLTKIGCSVQEPAPRTTSLSEGNATRMSQSSPDLASSVDHSSLSGSNVDWWKSDFSGSPQGIGHVGTIPDGDQTFNIGGSMNPLELGTTAPSFPNAMEFDSSWIHAENNLDWRFLDISLAQSHSVGTGGGTIQTFMERIPVDDVVATTMDDWLAQPTTTKAGT
ncbi:rrna-processing protein fcf1 [Paramyrothecium foliicola]|nr:rrna-processing protein fcf1 [Paramyrothecium foliicola]